MSKSRPLSRTTICTGSPGYDLHIQTNQPAVKASFVREHAAFFHTKDFGEKLNLLVGHNAALSFDVGEDVAGHVTPKQLQFPNKFVLRPRPSRFNSIAAANMSLWKRKISLATRNCEIGIHIQSIVIRNRAIAADIRATRIYIRATAGDSREIGIYRQEIASYIREIAADIQEIAVNIEEIAGYARRNAAAAVRPLPAARFAPVSAQNPFIFPFAACHAFSNFPP